MGAVGGAKAIKHSSEEIFQFECIPCKNDGIVKEAKFFCPDCQEYLCEACEVSHKRFRITRNHNVVLCKDVPISENTNEAQFVSSTTMCFCGRHQSELYCVYHNEIFCSDCKTMKHRQCQTKFIDEFITDLDQDFDNDTLKLADEVAEGIGKLQTERKQSLEKLNNDTGHCKKDIISFGKQLKKHIGAIQEKAVADLYSYSNRHKELIEHHLEVCDTALTTLSFDRNNNQKLKDSKNKRQRFLGHLKLTNTLKDVVAVVTCINNEVYQPNISFDGNQKLSDVLKTESLGKVNHNLQLKPRSFNTDMTVCSSQQTNVKLASDKVTPWISGSTFFPNGDLVLCDRGNKCIKMFDPEFRPKHTRKLSGQPRDCCLINYNEVLVTLPVDKQIQRFQTSPSIQLKRNITLDVQCECIASLNQDIFVTCHSKPDKEIRVLDQEGILKRRIVLNEAGEHFLYPFYIAVSDLGQIYVNESDDNSAQIRCLSHYGVYKHKVADQHLDGTGGILIDDEGRLLACFWRTKAVQILNEDGTEIYDFFDQDISLPGPYSISFRESDCVLVVTFRDHNDMLVCKLD